MGTGGWSLGLALNFPKDPGQQGGIAFLHEVGDSGGGKLQVLKGFFNARPEAFTGFPLGKVDLGDEFGQLLGLDRVVVAIISLDDFALIRGVVGHVGWISPERREPGRLERIAETPGVVASTSSTRPTRNVKSAVDEASLGVERPAVSRPQNRS